MFDFFDVRNDKVVVASSLCVYFLAWNVKSQFERDTEDLSFWVVGFKISRFVLKGVQKKLNSAILYPVFLTTEASDFNNSCPYPP